MKRLSGSKKILAVLGAGLLLTTTGTAFAMHSRDGHESHPAAEAQHKVEERHGQPPALVFTSPLPTPEPTDAHEDHDRHENEQHNGNVNSNDHEQDDKGGNVNSNDDNGNNNDHGSNSNDDHGGNGGYHG
jgi:hypothetical protein